MALIPEKVTNFRLYHNGADELLGVVDFEIPKLEGMTETLTGAGIAGEIESVTLGHMKALGMKYKLRTATAAALALPVGVSTLFIAKAAEQRQESGTGTIAIGAFRVETRGPVKTITPGKLEPGKMMDAEVEQSVTSLRIFVDGAPIVEFEPGNFVYRVGAVDYLSAIRAATA